LDTGTLEEGHERHPLPDGDRFKFTSRENDSEILQDFYRGRYYGPGIGRFESEDPAGFSAGDTDLYRYVINAPTDKNDPSGEFGPSGPADEGDFGLKPTDIPKEKPALDDKLQFVVQFKGWKNKTGFIIQHLKLEYYDEYRENNTLVRVGPHNDELWEAWMVGKGQGVKETEILVIQPKDNDALVAKPTDTFSVNPLKKGHKGHEYIRGKIKFIENYKIDLKNGGWKNGEFSGYFNTGDVPWTLTKPTGWDDAGAIDHEMLVDWDITGGDTNIKVKVVPTK
jgi:RHS repeat-associated protein